jgi:membrane protein implicated in regulation of membrane protease activity
MQPGIFQSRAARVPWLAVAAIVGAVFVLLAFQGGYWLVFGMFAILVWLGGVFGTLFLNGEKESLDAKAAAERRGKGVQ